MAEQRADLPDQAGQPLSGRRARVLLSAIIGVYLLLALGYGVVNPLFEAPDEHHHYFTAQYLAEERRLPEATEWSLWRQEAAQPPLYYALAAPLIAPFDTAGAGDQLWFNPLVQPGIAVKPVNKNVFVHTAAEAWPWQAYALAAHLVRMLSAVIGVGTLLVIYASGRLVWPQTSERALLATALVAFLPQFAFLHGSISNDVLIIFFSSLAVWQLLRLWLDGLSRARLLLLGATIGLAILSKLAGLLLLPLAAVVLLLLAWRDGRWRLVPEAIGLVLLPALLMSGWLFWRNWTLYGDLTAADRFVALAGGDRAFTLRQVAADFDRVWQSLFAFFGWMNVQPPPWAYAVWYGLVALALAGAIVALWRARRVSPDEAEASEPYGARPLLQRSWLPAFFLLLWFGLVWLAWLRFMIRTPADQGRLLYPTLLSLSLGMAYGLGAFRRRWLYLIFAGLALSTSLYSLLSVIPAAYPQPRIMAEAEIPDSATLLRADMGRGIELVAAELETPVLHPGEWGWLTLYWRVQQRPDTPPVAFLRLHGREDRVIGWQENYHGGGMFPATLWPPGKIVADRFAVQMDAQAAVPALLRLRVGAWPDMPTVQVAQAKGVPGRWPAGAASPLARLGGNVELVDASLSKPVTHAGDVVVVSAVWRVESAPGRALSTFVHLGDPAQAPLAQADGPAGNGEYPAYLWAATEVIADEYELLLPAGLAPGSYPVHIGLYEPDTGVRLPLRVGQARQPNDAFLVGWLEVAP